MRFYVRKTANWMSILSNGTGTTHMLHGAKFCVYSGNIICCFETRMGSKGRIIIHMFTWCNWIIKQVSLPRFSQPKVICSNANNITNRMFANFIIYCIQLTEWLLVEWKNKVRLSDCDNEQTSGRVMYIGRNPSKSETRTICWQLRNPFHYII